MELIGKEFRCKTPIPHRIYNDVQSGSSIVDIYIYIYIYNRHQALSYITYSKKTDNYIAKEHDGSNKFEPVDRTIKRKNINSRIEDGTDSSVKQYRIYDTNKIVLFTVDNESDEKVWFKGEIFLGGDAIKGINLNNGEKVTPMRVYYNVDKPLPEPLLSEEEGEEPESI